MHSRTIGNPKPVRRITMAIGPQWLKSAGLYTRLAGELPMQLTLMIPQIINGRQRVARQAFPRLSVTRAMPARRRITTKSMYLGAAVGTVPPQKRGNTILHLIPGPERKICRYKEMCRRSVLSAAEFLSTEENTPAYMFPRYIVITPRWAPTAVLPDWHALRKQIVTYGMAELRI